MYPQGEVIPSRTTTDIDLGYTSVDFRSNQGRLRFDPEKRFAILDFYIVRVVKKDGRLSHEVVDAMKQVKPD